MWDPDSDRTDNLVKKLNKYQITEATPKKYNVERTKNNNHTKLKVINSEDHLIIK